MLAGRQWQLTGRQPGRHAAVQAFFCGGCRYRVTADPSWPVPKVLSLLLLMYKGLNNPHARPAAQVKQALWQGGIQRANKPEAECNTPGMQQWSDLVSLFQCKAACMAEDKH